jgi:hypothetical protein
MRVVPLAAIALALAAAGPALAAPDARGIAQVPKRPTPASAKCGANLERSEALGYFFADTGCRGVNIKSTRYWASGVPIVAVGPFNDVSGRLVSRCNEDLATRTVKCLWKPANKGRTVAYVFAPVTFPRRVTVNVLAGGTGATGTVIVLRQDYLVRDDGTLRCSQSIPRAARCTRPPAG